MSRLGSFLITNILFSAAALCALRESDAAEPIRLRVLSYNIHHAEGVDRKLDVERIAGMIRSVEPDLVALQEVDQKVKRTQVVDQPAELAKLTKMQVVFGANIELQGGHYGNAVLSRFSITRHTNHLLPNIDDSEQRGVIEAEIKVPDSNEPLLLLATHPGLPCRRTRTLGVNQSHQRAGRQTLETTGLVSRRFERYARQQDAATVGNEVDTSQCKANGNRAGRSADETD